MRKFNQGNKELFVAFGGKTVIELGYTCRARFSNIIMSTHRVGTLVVLRQED